VLDLLSGNYTSKVDSGSATTDLILDHIPVVNLLPIYVYGMLLVLAVGLLYPLFYKVKDLHKVISQFSLLVMIRSFFIILTHLKTPVDAVPLDKIPWFFDLVSFRNDLFFSGHTAVPFLIFLIFRKEKIGKFFLFMTIVLAATVLLMHEHYSIDVFAAFFITWGSFQIGEWLFRGINGYRRE